VETKEEVGFPHSRNYVLIVVLLRQLEVDHYTDGAWEGSLLTFEPAQTATKTNMVLQLALRGRQAKVAALLAAVVAASLLQVSFTCVCKCKSQR